MLNCPQNSPIVLFYKHIYNFKRNKENSIELLIYAYKMIICRGECYAL